MANLKSDYKLMYENEAALKVTKTFPTTDDKPVKYLDVNKQPIEDMKKFRLIFEKDGKLFASESGKVSEAIEFSVYSDAGEILLGREF